MKRSERQQQQKAKKARRVVEPSDLERIEERARRRQENRKRREALGIDRHERKLEREDHHNRTHGETKASRARGKQ
jgi:hypothetical protein